MSKKKKLIILSGALLGVIFILLILAFTLFGLKTIEFNALNSTNILSTSQTQDEVKKVSNLKKHSCVLFLNKKNASANIENNFPYLKIVNIETKFPNKVIIHYAEREEVFAIQNGDKYFITDGELKVLRIVENAEGYSSSRQNPILLTGFQIQDSNVKRGEILSLKKHNELIKNFAQSLLLCNHDVVEQKSLIKQISLKYSDTQDILSGEGDYLEIIDFNNFVANFYSPSKSITQKLQVYFAGMTEVVPSYLSTHFMEIYTKSNGEIFCKLTYKL